jgi:GntR family transcriptional regulator, transcriptional repressor for pyruvate dehydrogenase complex
MTRVFSIDKQDFGTENGASSALLVGPMNSVFVAIKPKRVSEEIVDQIRSLIFQGKLMPGERLPPERDLARSLGVSRVSLREALNTLQGMGLLEIQQGNRTFVRPMTSKSIHDPLVAFSKDSPDGVLQIFELRKHLEMGACLLAAERATSDEIGRLERVMGEMGEDLKENRLGAKSDLDFHSIIADATHNQAYAHVLHTLYDLLQEELRIAWAGIFRSKEKRRVLFEQHVTVFKALRARDPERSRSEILRHLAFVEEQWLDAFGRSAADLRRRKVVG